MEGKSRARVAGSPCAWRSQFLGVKCCDPKLTQLNIALCSWERKLDVDVYVLPPPLTQHHHPPTHMGPELVREASVHAWVAVVRSVHPPSRIEPCINSGTGWKPPQAAEIVGEI